MEEQDRPYKEGTIKLTWIDDHDPLALHSRMFHSVQQALSNIEKNTYKNWLLFELTATDGNQYAWKILPHGEHRKLTTSMKIMNNPLLLLGTVAVLAIGAFYLGKAGVKLIKG